MASNSYTTDEWIRRASLVVAGFSGTTALGDGKGIDLSQMRFVFQTRAWDHQTFPTLQVRVYNLSDTTVKAILAKGEYTKVQLKAGYQEGWFSTIFRGTIKQFRTGRETPVDTFLDIFAADGDLLNWAYTSYSLPPGSTREDELRVLDEASKAQAKIDAGERDVVLGDSQGVFQNGKARYGLVTRGYDDIAYNSNSSWHVWGGQLHIMKNDSVLPGDAIVLNAQTGLIGMPEAAQDGVHVRCLLNPSIRPGSKIQINNGDINKVHNSSIPGASSNFANLTGQGPLQFFASTAADGFYRVLYVEHQGDTRGQPWYTDIVCATYNSDTNRASADLGSGYNAVNGAPFGSPGGAGPDVPDDDIQ